MNYYKFHIKHILLSADKNKSMVLAGGNLFFVVLPGLLFCNISYFWNFIAWLSHGIFRVPIDIYIHNLRHASATGKKMMLKFLKKNSCRIENKTCIYKWFNNFLFNQVSILLTCCFVKLWKERTEKNEKSKKTQGNSTQARNYLL